MKKILFIILCFVSTVSFAQSYLTNNAVFNLKDSRNSNVYRFAYLNNTDSIATMDSVGLRIIRPLRFKGGTTSQRPAFAVEGMLWYNSDSLKLEYYNGAAWQSLGVSTSTTYTAGSGLTLSAGQFKLGGTLSENLSLSTTGAYTFSLTDGTTPLIHTDINERISIGGTNNSGYKFFVNGDFGAASGTGALYFNGATSLIYTAGTADMALRLTGRSKEFRHLIFTTAYVFRPNTDNTLPYEIQNVAGEKIYATDFSNKLNKLYYVPTATSTDTKLLVHGNSDSAIRQLDFPIVQGTYTATKTDVTNIGTATLSTLHYQRLGDYIEVGGEITIDPTATGDTHLRITLPIASTITNSYDLFGTASAHDVNQVVRIYGDTVNSAAIFRLTAADASSHVYSFKFRYKYVAP